MKLSYFYFKVLLVSLCSILLSVVTTGCSESITEPSENSLVSITENNEIAKSYFLKDTTGSFKEFLKNPDENAQLTRTARSAATEDAIITENDLFAALWDSLTEEEKSMVVQNAENATVACDSELALAADSFIGRAVLTGDCAELDNLAVIYGFTAKLQDWFGGVSIPRNMIPESLPDDYPDELPAELVFDKYIKEENWNAVKSFLAYLDSPIDLKTLKAEKTALDSIDTALEEKSRGSVVMTLHDTALRENLGITLKNGTVLLTSSKEKAFVVAGKYVHGGIFCKELFDNRGKKDSVHCVYSAQPADVYDDYPADRKPDRPGYACLDTIYMYTKQQRYATLLPKGWNTNSAATAVAAAKAIYDAKPKYNLPWWEMFCIFNINGLNTSHDLKNDNMYCTKVVYNAWKKADKNLDAETFAGNLVSPDDIYGSCADRYFSITIRILWWSKTYRWKTYSATSNLIETREG